MASAQLSCKIFQECFPRVFDGKSIPVCKSVFEECLHKRVSEGVSFKSVPTRVFQHFPTRSQDCLHKSVFTKLSPQECLHERVLEERLYKHVFQE